MKKNNSLECIILIDDDKITNYINKKIIKKANIDTHIMISSNSEDALLYLKKLSLEQATNNENKIEPRPSIIFLDINMPKMNGWDFIAEYKKLPDSTKNNIQITMLTTSVNPDDEKKASTLPEINYFLKKPLTKEKLLDTINRFY